MTEADLLALISRRSGKAVLKALAKIPAGERRAHAGAVGRLFKLWSDTRWSSGKGGKTAPSIADADALRIALLATATPTELKRFGVDAKPHKVPLVDVFSALQPDWTDRWVAAIIADSPHFVGRLSPLWKAGLCTRPTDDAFILGYYAHNRSDALEPNDPQFLAHDVWRFFEVEGGGEFSLAGHDKYCAPDEAWSAVLGRLSESERLDRQRLLDASLDALERDFGQFRAGWYSRFHTSLAPSVEEMHDRSDRYLRLLSSTIPPTVSFALKSLKALDKAGRLSPEAVLSDIAPALQARQKSTAAGALQLLASAAKRNPEHAIDAARLAAAALISEGADVQAKALDLIERIGGQADPETRELLGAHLESVAPSMRARVAAMAAVDASTAPEVGIIDTPVATARPVSAINAPAEALAAFLSVLEAPRDPFEVERAMDGLSRHGAMLDAAALSPLRKRAKQVFDNPGESAIRFVLAVTGCALAEGVSLREILIRDNPDPKFLHLSEHGFARVFLDRNAEILDHVLNGQGVPMLSAPSTTVGTVAPGDLVSRLQDCRELGVEPGLADLNLALMRLDPEGRAEVLGKFEPKTEADRAVTFALGAEQSPEGNAALWAAAWFARRPVEDHAGVAALAGKPAPDVGHAAGYTVVVRKDGNDPYYWAKVSVEIAPEPQSCDRRILPALFHLPRPHKYFNVCPCGTVYPDVAWSSLASPVNTEPFFRHAILEMETYQKLSDHFCLAYIEPFFRPGFKPGSMAVSTLAYYLASEDKSVTVLTAEAVATLAEDGRLDAQRLAQALRPFLMCGPLPVMRWTKGFASVAEAGPVPSAFICEVIEALLDFDPTEPPRDIGGMVELLFELHIAAGSHPTSASALACLKGITAGGKLGRFSKKLLAMAG